MQRSIKSETQVPVPSAGTKKQFKGLYGNIIPPLLKPLDDKTAEKLGTALKRFEDSAICFSDRDKPMLESRAKTIFDFLEGCAKENPGAGWNIERRNTGVAAVISFSSKESGFTIAFRGESPYSFMDVRETTAMNPKGPLDTIQCEHRAGGIDKPSKPTEELIAQLEYLASALMRRGTGTEKNSVF